MVVSTLEEGRGDDVGEADEDEDVAAGASSDQPEGGTAYLCGSSDWAEVALVLVVFELLLIRNPL